VSERIKLFCQNRSKLKKTAVIKLKNKKKQNWS